MLLMSVRRCFFSHQSKVRWARNKALPQLSGMVSNSWRDSSEAYQLAEEAERYIPNDPQLAAIFAKISLKINITTDPAGARVLMRKYEAPENEWKYVGLSPIHQQLRVPIGIYATKIEKDGYETVLAAATTF